MIDQSSGNPAVMLHLPEVQLAGIESRLEVGEGTFRIEIERPERAMLFYALKGSFRMQFEDGEKPIEIAEGTAVGLQSGIKHYWIGLNGPDHYEMFISSIERKAGLLQRLEREVIVVPPDCGSSATIIRHAVAIHLTEIQTRMVSEDDMIIRRCAEIVMAELVRFARNTIVQTAEVPSGVEHDEYLLRAWSAYYAAPRERWTVKALADAAGLGRSAFFERFRKATGVPPLTAITDLRLAQAEAMLRDAQTPLIEIAFTVGYNSEAAFVRAFHRKYGMPPGRFRHEHVSAGAHRARRGAIPAAP